MAKNIADKVLTVRMTQKEYEKLQRYADRKEISMSRVVKDYIKRLPDYPADESD